MFQSIEICHSIRLPFNRKRMIPKNNPKKIENSIHRLNFRSFELRECVILNDLLNEQKNVMQNFVSYLTNMKHFPC